MIYNIDCQHGRHSADPRILIFPKPRTGIFLPHPSLMGDHLPIASNYFFFNKLYMD